MQDHRVLSRRSKKSRRYNLQEVDGSLRWYGRKWRLLQRNDRVPSRVYGVDED